MSKQQSNQSRYSSLSSKIFQPNLRRQNAQKKKAPPRPPPPKISDGKTLLSKSHTVGSFTSFKSSGLQPNSKPKEACLIDLSSPPHSPYAGSGSDGVSVNSFSSESSTNHSGVSDDIFDPFGSISDDSQSAKVTIRHEGYFRIQSQAHPVVDDEDDPFKELALRHKKLVSNPVHKQSSYTIKTVPEPKNSLSQSQFYSSSRSKPVQKDNQRQNYAHLFAEQSIPRKSDSFKSEQSNMPSRTSSLKTEQSNMSSRTSSLKTEHVNMPSNASSLKMEQVDGPSIGSSLKMEQVNQPNRSAPIKMDQTSMPNKTTSKFYSDESSKKSTRATIIRPKNTSAVPPSISLPSIARYSDRQQINKPKEEETSYGEAIYDFNAIEPTDLSFQAGQKLELLRRINPEWLYGKIGTREGMFPHSFIQIIVPLKEESSQNESKLEKVPEEPKKWPVAALYTFNGEYEGDLSFCEGDVINICGKINDDWLFGELHGACGQLPTNFVDNIPPNLPVYKSPS